MFALKGIYENDVVKLEESLNYDKPVEVIVTFLEEEKPKKLLQYNDFSFEKSKKQLEKYNFSLSDEIIKERQGE